jgi:nucleotide-binding universal stress UspA family protein
VIRIGRIVCPVDFSEFSRRALDRAAVLARWYEAELVALHATPLVPVDFPLAPGVSPATLAPFDVEAMAGELRAFSAEVAARCPRLRLIVRSGPPAPVILDLARGLGADLLVIGTHGRSGFRKLVLGSVAEKVMDKAPCPVLTVPYAAQGSPDTPVFRRVLCGVDFSEASRRAVEFATSLAEEANGRLILLHSIEWPIGDRHPTHATFGVNLYRQSLLTDARARLAALVPAEARDWCQVDARAASDEPAAELLRLAAAERADLIVVGADRPRPIDRMLFGSVAPLVIRQAPCPVLTVGSRCAGAGHEVLDQTTHTAGHVRGGY